MGVPELGAEGDILGWQSGGKCTAAHCTVAAVWLTLFHITSPSCLSFPAEFHLPLWCHSFRSSSVPLNVHGHESAAQYGLRVIQVWTFAQPSLTKSTVPYHVLDPNIFGLPSNYFGPGRFCNAAGHNSTHSCTFPQQIFSWLQPSVYTIHVVITLVWSNYPTIPRQVPISVT